MKNIDTFSCLFSDYEEGRYYNYDYQADWDSLNLEDIENTEPGKIKFKANKRKLVVTIEQNIDYRGSNGVVKTKVKFNGKSELNNDGEIIAFDAKKVKGRTKAIVEDEGKIGGIKFDAKSTDYIEVPFCNALEGNFSALPEDFDYSYKYFGAFEDLIVDGGFA